MLYQLKRHPFSVRAYFRHVLVLTYAYPRRVLEPLVPPGLALETMGDLGFLAVAMVQCVDLRPAFLPRWLGRRLFLAGYRIFVGHRDSSGRTRRGLRILRSNTDRWTMVLFGNLLTHYQYEKVAVRLAAADQRLEVDVASGDGAADLHVIADLADGSAPLPEGSPFRDHREARRFAGPLPYTFDYEPQTHSIIRIQGVRRRWNPKPVPVRVLKNTFLQQPPLSEACGILAAAFYLHDIDYLWRRGVRERLQTSFN